MSGPPLQFYPHPGRRLRPDNSAVCGRIHHKRKGERIRTIDKFLCIALGIESRQRRHFCPTYPQAAPGSGHCVGLSVFLGRHQHPIAFQSSEKGFFKRLRGDFFPLFHKKKTSLFYIVLYPMISALLQLQPAVDRRWRWNPSGEFQPQRQFPHPRHGKNHNRPAIRAIGHGIADRAPSGAASPMVMGPHCSPLPPSPFDRGGRKPPQGIVSKSLP